MKYDVKNAPIYIRQSGGERDNRFASCQINIFALDISCHSKFGADEKYASADASAPAFIYIQHEMSVICGGEERLRK